MRLTEDEKGIIRRAFARHYYSLRSSADKCSGDLWYRIYKGEADRTEALLKKLLGKNETLIKLVTTSKKGDANAAT